MAKATEGDKTRLFIQVGGFLVLLGTIIFSAGSVFPKIQTNTDEIHRVDNQGCEPSRSVRERLSGMDAIDQSLRNDLIRIETANAKEFQRISDKLDSISKYLIEHNSPAYNE